MMIALDDPMTQQAFGDLVGIGQTRVSALVAAGVLQAEMTYKEAVRAYCGNLRTQASGRQSAPGELSLTAERARHAKEQADKLQMQNEVMQGELAPVAIIEMSLGELAGRIRSKLEAIPGAIRRRNAALPHEDLALVAEEVGFALNSISEMQFDPDWLRRQASRVDFKISYGRTQNAGSKQ